MTASIRVLGDAPYEVPALYGETILTSLLQAGVPFPHNCQSGNCGSCKCELVEGDVLELPYSEYALSPEERARNIVLACRTQAWGDCIVRPLDDDEHVAHPSRVLRCQVTACTDLTHDIKALTLAVEAGGPYVFSAGQHAKLKFGPGIPERNYSMANRPDEPGLTFIVRQVPRGQASGYVFGQLRPGAAVTVSGPLGNAYLRDGHRGPILAVAGGSGIAPIKSIVDTALSVDGEREIHVYLGVRDERDVVLAGWLDSLAARYPRVSSSIVLSDPSGQTPRLTGLVSDAVAADLRSLAGFKAYVAGPPPLVEALKRKLLEADLPLRDVHADAFYSQAEDAFNLT
jgi:CDP-4-dehydro-6-deoxyglucose reductase/ferredoxin-NAD(P)+ reductase (naphthalene dioxygenase ferredoxin-specific)